MSRELELVRLLADGEYRSGEVLAARLGMTRAGVWKTVRAARERLGLAVDSVRGRGYRLDAPLELLDADLILAELSGRTPSGSQADAGEAPQPSSASPDRPLAPAGRSASGPRIARLAVYGEIDSTNARLMSEARAGAPSGSVCLAERQSAGRGRRGRVWVSPFGANLYLSILWRFPCGPAALGGASLAAGVAVAQVLWDAGARDLCLKWPNDLLWQRRKLGGLLLEVAGEAQGPSYLVAGLGLNLHMSPGQGAAIDQPWTDLSTALGGHLPGRNRLAARAIGALAAAFVRYGELGLAPFLADWEAFDGLLGAPVRLHLGDRTVEGEHAGVAPDGALRLLTPQGIETYHAGEVTLRTQ